MPKPKLKTLATSTTMEGLIGRISDYYYGATISLVEDDGSFKVHNAKGFIPGVRVVHYLNGYKFGQI